MPVNLTVKEFNLEGQRLPKSIQEYFDTAGETPQYASAYDGRVLVLEEIEKEPSSSATTDAAKTAVVSYPSGSSTINERICSVLSRGMRENISRSNAQQKAIPSFRTNSV